MRIGKLKLFLIINGSIALALTSYFALWFLSPAATGKMISPFYASTITLNYVAGGKEYQGTYMRNGISYSDRSVEVSYLSFQPESSRVRSFLGICGEPLAWWFVFLLASSMLLLTDNLVFSKGTIFVFQKKFPWVSMEEFYPFETSAEEPHTARPKGAVVKKQRLIGGK
jgi:hypothetical protein